MPQVKITRIAQIDLSRIYNFLNDLGATKQANDVMSLLKNSFETTQNKPNNGREYKLSVDNEALENVREVTVKYGKSGYSYLFHHNEQEATIYILTIKHFRENSYSFLIN